MLQSFSVLCIVEKEGQPRLGDDTGMDDDNAISEGSGDDDETGSDDLGSMGGKSGKCELELDTG